MRNKRSTAPRSSGCSRRPLRGAADGLHRGQGARAPAPRARGHRHRVARQGARGDARPGRALAGHGYVVGAAPRRADGQRPRRAGRDLRPARPAGHHAGSSCPAATPSRRATTPTPCRCCEDLDELGRPFAQVGITGYPESHPTINDDLTIQSMWDKRRHATHIVSNLTFDPAAISTGWAGCAAAASPCRCCSASPGRSTAPSCSRWPPRSASASRPGSWPSTRARSPGSPRPAASPARGSSRSARPPSAQPGALVEGLHVFTFNQIAETEAWRTRAAGAAAALTGRRGQPLSRRRSARAAARGRSSRRSVDDGERQPEPTAAAASAGRAQLGVVGLLGEPDDARVVAEVVVAQLRLAVEARARGSTVRAKERTRKSVSR